MAIVFRSRISNVQIVGTQTTPRKNATEIIRPIEIH